MFSHIIFKKCTRSFISFEFITINQMITTRLKKQCSTKNLLVQFSMQTIPSTLQQFYNTCKEQGVQVRRDHLKCNQLNFYAVEKTSTVQVKKIKLENIPQNIEFALTVLYISSEVQEQELQNKSPKKRTILLRQGLDMKFYHEYEFQNTQSEFQSVIYLCELATAIINSQIQEDVNFYDQKTEEIRGNNEENLREKLWKNILYQIPGLGKEKCQAISQKYSTYESLLDDYMGRKQLKNLSVSRGIKEVRLGSVLANRIYRCLFSEDGYLSIYEQ